MCVSDSKKSYIYWGLILILSVLAIVYTKYSPEEYSLYPKCLLYRMTGFECPSCGVQRAVHALLNGEVKKAIEYNPFLTAAIPYLLGIIYAKIFNNKVALKLRKYLMHRYSLYSYIIAYFVWWILRNI